MLSSTLLDGNVRRVICNGQEIRSRGLGKNQKLVSQHFDADVGAPAAPGLGTPPFLP